jgi:hypothetical protein
MERLQVADEGRGGIHEWSVATHILNSNLEQPTRKDPPVWGLGEVLRRHVTYPAHL